MFIYAFQGIALDCKWRWSSLLHSLLSCSNTLLPASELDSSLFVSYIKGTAAVKIVFLLEVHLFWTQVDVVVEAVFLYASWHEHLWIDVDSGD